MHSWSSDETRLNFLSCAGRNVASTCVSPVPAARCGRRSLDTEGMDVDAGTGTMTSVKVLCLCLNSMTTNEDGSAHNSGGITRATARPARVMPRPVSDGASEIRPPPGARRLLVWSTQAAIRWAIATSGRMGTAAVNLAALDVDPVQIPVITRDQVRYAKPDPDLFLAAESRRRTDVFDRSMKELNCPVYLCRLNRSTQHSR
jgi:hypothetical protein